MKPSDFDKRFDAGSDVSASLDWSKARRKGTQAQRVNVDFPTWMVESLDKEARKFGVTRQSLIKLWIADKLSHQTK